MVSSAEQLRREILAGIAPPRIGPGRLAVAPAPGQLQTEQLQQAIDALSAAGGGVLELGPGVYTTGALRLKDGVELRLASPETRLCFTPEDPERNYPLVYAHWEATPCYNYSALLYACDAADIAVTGPGVLDGGADGLTFYRCLTGPWQKSLRPGGWLVLDAAAQATARLVVARALGALGCLYWLSLSTPLPEVLEVLRRVHVPGPVLDLAVLIYRYIFVMLDTAARMHISAASRLGYEGAGRSLRTTGLVYANLLGRSFGRARVCQQAMESRGWEGDIRFLVRPKPVRAAHLIPFAAPAAAMLLALWLGG